ncbi:hypothetical protein [Novibacillus thermophilus]
MDYDFKLLKSVVHVNEDQRYNVIEEMKAVTRVLCRENDWHLGTGL